MARLADDLHFARPWRIHDVLPDFRLEDVWALPTPGGPDDFAGLVDLFAGFDPARDTPLAVRALFAARFTLGRVLHWDGPGEGTGTRVSTLRERLPADLRAGPTGPRLGLFDPLFLTHDEYAAEVANRTVHGVLHLGWVREGAGYRGELAVYAKPNGLLGRGYMAAIAPFRYLLVYPMLTRAIGREWEASRAAVPA